MEIKVIGTGCGKCDRLYDNVKEALEELELEASLIKIEDLMEIVSLGVLTSPSLMVDGRLVVSGQEASVKKIKSILESI